MLKMFETYICKKRSKNKYMKIPRSALSCETYALFFPNHTLNNFPRFLLRIKDYYNDTDY